MNLKSLFLIAFLILTMLSKNSFSQSETALIEQNLKWTKTVKKHQIGYVKTGDNLKESLKKLKNDFQILFDSTTICVGCEEYEYFYKLYDKQDKFVFSLHPGYEESNKHLVFRMELYDKEYVTDKGIKIGDCVKQLKEKYTLNDAYFNYEIGLYLFVDDFSGSFGIELNEFKGLDINFENIQFDAVPEDLLINEIVVL